MQLEITIITSILTSVFQGLLSFSIFVWAEGTQIDDISCLLQVWTPSGQTIWEKSVSTSRPRLLEFARDLNYLYIEHFNVRVV